MEVAAPLSSEWQTSLAIFHLLVFQSAAQWGGGAPISRAGGQPSHARGQHALHFEITLSLMWPIGCKFRFPSSVIPKIKHTCINLIDTTKTLRKMNILKVGRQFHYLTHAFYSHSLQKLGGLDHLTVFCLFC